MTSIYIRPAVEADLPGMTALRIAAFGNNPENHAIFPDVATRAVDFAAWRTSTMLQGFADPGRRTVVAMERRPDGTEDLAGVAEWHAPGGPSPGLSAEERAARRVGWPASIDLAMLKSLEDLLATEITKAMTQAGLPAGAEKDMWELAGLAVDTRYQRKGIGHKLVQWGMDQAAEEKADALIVANDMGSHLYRRAGFQEVAKFSVLPGTIYERDSWIFLLRHKDHKEEDS